MDREYAKSLLPDGEVAMNARDDYYPRADAEEIIDSALSITLQGDALAVTTNPLEGATLIFTDPEKYDGGAAVGV